MPIGTTAAIIGAGILGAGASVVSANKNKKAISQSTDASLAAQREANLSAEKIAAQQIAAQKEALDKGLGYQTNAFNAGTQMSADTYNSTGRLNTDIYNQRQQILQPWTSGGFSAFNQLNGMLGLPQQQAYTPQTLAFTPVTAQQITAPVTPAPAATTPAPGSPSTVPVTQPVTAPMSYADAQRAALARLM